MRGWDADSVGSAGADGATGGGVEGFVEADFDGGEVVVATTQGEVFAGEMRIGGGEEGEDLFGRHGDLVGELGELWWNNDAVEGGTGEGEEVIGGEAGAGAVCLPLVAEEAEVGVDVAVPGRVAGAGVGGTVLGGGAV